MLLPTTSNAYLAMDGLREMGVTVIKVNGLIILAFMQKLENMYCFTTPREVMATGFLNGNVLNFRATVPPSPARYSGGVPSVQKRSRCVQSNPERCPGVFRLTRGNKGLSPT